MGSKNSTPAQRPHAMSQHSSVAARNDDGPITNQAVAEGKTGAVSGGDPSARIKVRAIADGYYQHIYRRERDVFVLIPIRLTAPSQLARRVADGLGPIMTAEEQFSERWMERVAPSTPTNISTSADALKEKHDEIIRDKMGLADPNEGRSDPNDVEEESVI